MKLFIQIALPIVVYLVIGLSFSKDRDDVKYVLILPFAIIGLVGILTAIGIGLNWLYN